MRNYFSYEIKSHRLRNITKDIVTRWDSYDIEPTPTGLAVNNFLAWIAGGRYVLLNDSYDIWLIDLLNVKSAINVTNGYGRRHHITFRMAMKDDNALVDSHETLILSAFDKNNNK